jgi:Leucine-rich repeat (LRR) protein
MKNKMEKLALFEVPSLSSLSCGCNRLAELDLSHVPNLTRLSCYKNRIAELELKATRRSRNLCYDHHITELIQRLDQNF